MDSISQMALGAALADATLGRRIGRRAAALGAALGTLPDLDVLVRYADAIDSFTLHRGWSHSLFVLSLASLPLAAIAQRLLDPGVRARGGSADRAEPAGAATARAAGAAGTTGGPSGASFGRWWLATWAVLITHAILDAFTTYGTQLFWPLPVPPVSIGSVFIIDPFYTLPLLAGLVVALRRRDARGRRANLAGLGASTAWLVATLGLQQVARAEAAEAFELAGVEPEATLVLPFPFGVLWRAIALEGDGYAVVWVSLVDGRRSVEVERHDRALDDLALDDRRGLERLDWFTGGFVGARRVDDRLVLTDLRIGTGAMPVFAFEAAEPDGDRWRATLAEERAPVVDASVLGALARRTVDADAPLVDGPLAGTAPVP